LIHDSLGHIKESLFLEIMTNGSLTPKRSLLEAVKILIHLFYPLLLTPQLAILSNRVKELNQIKQKEIDNKDGKKKRIKKISKKKN
jgi:DNA-directed RNA polymerase alpha subunit